MNEPNKIELDDLQQLRHGASVVGQYIAVFYRELRTAGVPRKLARKVAFDQWTKIGQDDQTEALKEMREMMQGFFRNLGDSPDDD